MTREQEMRQVLARWKESGRSLLAFSKGEGLSYSKLQYWAGKLGERKATGKKAVELAPVRLVPEEGVEAAKREPLSVWLSNGIALEIPAGFDEGELRRLVAVLATC